MKSYRRKEQVVFARQITSGEELIRRHNYNAVASPGDYIVDFPEGETVVKRVDFESEYDIIEPMDTDPEITTEVETAPIIDTSDKEGTDEDTSV